jgi:novobiocin biosynthesis protein NovU/D-mycarose 3-C-methyltransferase
MMPAPNNFPETEDDVRKEELYSLRFSRCEDCGLAMIDEIVSPEKLFSTYHYLTSASTPLVAHFRDLAEESKKRFGLSTRTKALDIGANDGTLLAEFHALGAQTLGVDPAKNVALIAQTKGVNVLPEFFSSALAHDLGKAHGRFDIITATNVFAHTNDIQDFARGVKTLLAPDGVFIVECAHLLEMFDKKFFDVIYHEHLSFFALEPLLNFFERYGLRIFDVKKVLTQGGSLRMYVTHTENPALPATDAIRQVVAEERHHRLHERSAFEAFARGVQEYRATLRSLLQDLKNKGKRIVGIGAPAKGVILLNYCRIDGTILDYLVDSTPLKQHRFMPGVHIPVYPEEKLAEDPVDYFLLLAYNFQDAILQKLAPYRERGARVILPFPAARVL